MELPSPDRQRRGRWKKSAATRCSGSRSCPAVFPLRAASTRCGRACTACAATPSGPCTTATTCSASRDKEAFRDGLAPIPSLLALAAVHNYLCHQGLRERCSLVVQAGDVQEGHDIACLVAFGADAVHPYLMLPADPQRADHSRTPKRSRNGR